MRLRGFRCIQGPIRVQPPTLRSLACAAALAVPAYFLTNESFRPIEHRVHLEGGAAGSSFELGSPESLYFEFEFIVRAPSEPRSAFAPSALRRDRSVLVLRLNGTPVAAVQVERLYVVQRARVLAPLGAVRTGENRLHVTVDGPSPATFELNLRVHNYYGISPRFPRAAVVSDEAAGRFFGQRSIGGHALRFGVFALVSFIVLAGIVRTSSRRARAGAAVLMVAPSVLLWCTLFYGLATARHVWLSVDALVAMAAAPFVAAVCALWIAAHRLAVARVAGATAVTFVALEIALRVFNDFNPSPIFYTDSYSRYRGQPGAPYLDSHLNSRGFNDVDHDWSKAPSVYRIAAIGDSVAFGVVPYRANYLTLLESELSANRAVEVINLGVPATGPRDYLMILLEEGLALDPDLVMIGFFIGNDFELAARKPYEHSYVATALYFFWRLWSAGTPAMVRFDSSAARYDDDEPSLSTEQFLEIAVDRAWIYSKADTRLQTAMARAVGYLRDMRDISQRAGAALLVVLIPDEAQVDASLQEEVVRAHRSLGDEFDFSLPNRLLAVELSKEGIPFLDLLPVFEEAGTHTRLYKPRDTHWNLAGNRLAAAAIARFLRGVKMRPGWP